MNNWILRSISGIVLIGVVIGAILLSEYTLLLLSLFMFSFSLIEFRTIFKVRDQVISTLLLVLGQVSIIYFYLHNVDILGLHWLLFISIAAITILILTYLLFPGISFKEFGLMLFATFWFVGTISFMLSIGWVASDVYTPRYLVILFVLIWVNDIAAFTFGSLFGKKLLAPRVSPGKTWEGFISGILMNGIAGYLIAIFSHTFNPLFWIITGMVIGVSATAGDLFESKLKRDAGVKDSGNLIPGHGGMLDRFDSLMFSAPLYYGILLSWNYL